MKRERMFRQGGSTTLHRCFTALVLVGLPANVFGQALQNVSPIDPDISIQGMCELSGGNFNITDLGEQMCCWPNWGCLLCSSTVDGDCFMLCDTLECCRKNGRPGYSNGCAFEDSYVELVVADPEDEPEPPIFEQPQAGDSQVVVGDDGPDTLIGDLVLGTTPDYTPIGGVAGEYTPQSLIELFELVAPDFQREDFESLSDEGTYVEPFTDEGTSMSDPDNRPEPDPTATSNEMCGAAGAGSFAFGLMGLVGLAGTQRRSRRR